MCYQNCKEKKEKKLKQKNRRSKKNGAPLMVAAGSEYFHKTQMILRKKLSDRVIKTATHSVISTILVTIRS